MTNISRSEQLNFRRKKFHEFTSSITLEGSHVGEGLYVVNLPDKLFDNIRTCCIQFLSKMYTKKNVLLQIEDVEELLNPDIFKKFENVTPSGMILPKFDTSFEYNYLMKNFYGITNYLNMPVQSWYSILPLRYKASYKDDYVPGIQYSHEVHLDSWTGFSNYAYAAFLPLLGDIENNYIEYWEPTDGIEESWISGNKSEIERVNILKNFKKINFKLRRGQFAIADSYGAHNTLILSGAKARISIDNLFIPSWAKNFNHIQSNFRQSDLIGNDILTKIGHKYYFDFIDDYSVRRPSMGGLKSPIGFNLIDLKS